MSSEHLKILVMDDERVVADSLAQILELFGYEASAVYDPVQALEWLSSHTCDVLISDVMVPGHISGIDLAIQIGSLFPKCKVVLISGNNSTAELILAAQQGGHLFDLLAKPVHPTVILERLKAITGSDAGAVPVA
jgi:DNA-binding NtrC family response regulator